GAPVRRCVDLGDEGGDRERLRAAVADHHRHVLLAVRQVADWSVARHVAEARAPEFLPRGVVVGREYAIECAGTHATTGRRERARRLRRTLTLDPDGLMRFQVDRLEPAV